MSFLSTVFRSFLISLRITFMFSIAFTKLLYKLIICFGDGRGRAISASEEIYYLPL